MILWLIPEQHASFSTCSPQTVNNTGFFGGSTSGLGFLLFVLPISAILTQYTITGYDASAHLSEETKSAADGAAKGIWRSIFYSAIGGWILLLTFLFAVQDVDGVTAGGGAVVTIFTQAMDSKWVGDRPADLDRGAVLLHHGLPDQRVAHAVRVQPRPGRARPSALVQGQQEQVPANGVIVTAVIAAIITLPALVEVDINGAPGAGRVLRRGVHRRGRACTCASRCRSTTAGRPGDAFPVGKWNLRGHHKWMAPVALIEIIVTSIIAMFPTSIGGAPWDRQLRVEVRQLHPAAGRRRADPAVHLLARVGEELVHRADQAGRRDRRASWRASPEDQPTCL